MTPRGSSTHAAHICMFHRPWPWCSKTVMFCLCVRGRAGARLGGGGGRSVSPGQRRRNKVVHGSRHEHQERQDLPGEHPAGHLSAGRRQHGDPGDTDAAHGSPSPNWPLQKNNLQFTLMCLKSPVMSVFECKWMNLTTLWRLSSLPFNQMWLLHWEVIQMHKPFFLFCTYCQNKWMAALFIVFYFVCFLRSCVS